MSLVRLTPGDLARDDLLQLVHLEPVEDSCGDRLDQVARLELRLLDRVAADEGRALEDGVVELPPARDVRARRDDERARLQPLAAQHRVARARDGHDHVLHPGLAVALGRLGAHALAERGQPLLRPAVRHDAFELTARPRGCRRPASPPGARSRCTPSVLAPRRARWRAATPLAAPVRSLPRWSASITPASVGPSVSKMQTTKKAPSPVAAYSFPPARPSSRSDAAMSASDPAASCRRRRGAFTTSPRAMRRKHSSIAATASAGSSSAATSSSVR